jgi:Ca2+-dependent lipid-binding protein
MRPIIDKVNQMNTSKSLYKDVMTGLFFITGVLSFMSGQFIFSTLLFGVASLTSNLNLAMPARI